MFYEFNHLASPDYLRVEKKKGRFSFPAHLHQCFEMIFVKNGQMKVTVSDEEYILNGGEAVLIFPNLIHSLSSENSEHSIFIFSSDLVSAYTSKVAGKIPENPVFVPSEYLTEELGKAETASLISKKGLFYLLCGEFELQTTYKERKYENEKLLYRIFCFVEDNYRSDSSLSALSEATGYDYSYLSRFFKQTVGINYNSYVVNYRLGKACNLLENTDKPVIQCALETGYVSLRNFNRSFKDYYKVTPSQFRKSVKKHT